MRSISELSAEANAYDFSNTISFSKWAHTCNALLRESRVYDSEGDASAIEHAYILYLRFSDLVLNKLCTHPELPNNKKQFARLANLVPHAIERSQELKQKLLSSVKIPEPQKVEVEETDFINRELRKYENKLVPELELNSLPSLKMPQPQTHQPPLQHVVTPTPPNLTAPASIPLKEHQTDIPNEIKSVHQTERGRPLRYIFVPKTLRSKFLELASSNTSKNLETCGMLCGKLQRNAFFITDLLIPHQESTSDSCATTNEEELFTYVDEKDLFIVGWIHTHPTQSCFMSSVDLHTHAAYQLMLPEAVAVVCAPRANPDWSSFRLTDPPGIDRIRSCTLTGFHPHKNPSELYCVPEHYREFDFELTAVDLRF